jgi:hypothetical protein
MYIEHSKRERRLAVGMDGINYNPRVRRVTFGRMQVITAREEGE